MGRNVNLISYGSQIGRNYNLRPVGKNLPKMVEKVLESSSLQKQSFDVLIQSGLGLSESQS
jgi:hypothetical protein